MLRDTKSNNMDRGDKNSGSNALGRGIRKDKGRWLRYYSGGRQIHSLSFYTSLSCICGHLQFRDLTTPQIDTRSGVV
jgi:hypothetical protein